MNKLDGWTFLRLAVSRWRTGTPEALIESALYCRLSFEGRLEEYRDSRPDDSKKKIQPHKSKSAILELEKVMHSQQSIVEVVIGGTKWYYTPISVELSTKVAKLGNLLHYDSDRFHPGSLQLYKSEIKDILTDLIIAYLGGLTGTPYVKSPRELAFQTSIRDESVQYWRNNPRQNAQAPARPPNKFLFGWKLLKSLPRQYINQTLRHMWQVDSIEEIFTPSMVAPPER